jgi:hypothetical protein
LLKVQNFSHEEIAEWHGAKNPAPAPEPAPVVEDVEEPEDD